MGTTPGTVQNPMRQNFGRQRWETDDLALLVSWKVAHGARSLLPFLSPLGRETDDLALPVSWEVAHGARSLLPYLSPLGRETDDLALLVSWKVAHGARSLLPYLSPLGRRNRSAPFLQALLGVHQHRCQRWRSFQWVQFSGGSRVQAATMEQMKLES